MLLLATQIHEISQSGPPHWPANVMSFTGRSWYGAVRKEEWDGTAGLCGVY